MSLFKKDPAKEFTGAQKNISRLGKKREKLKKDGEWKHQDEIADLNRKMSVQFARKEAAAMQLQNPAPVTKKTNVNVSISRQQNKKSVEFHGHYHAEPKKQGSKSSRKKK